MVKFETKEIIFTISGMILLLVWFLWLKDIAAPFLMSIPPFIAMLLYSSVLFISLYLMTSVLDGKTFKLKLSATVWLFALGLDIIEAPYLVTKAGELLTSADYFFVSSDFGFGSLYHAFLPLSWVWFATYIFTPIILMLIVPALILAPKQIAKMFGH